MEEIKSEKLNISSRKLKKIMGNNFLDKQKRLFVSEVITNIFSLINNVKTNHNNKKIWKGSLNNIANILALFEILKIINNKSINFVCLFKTLFGKNYHRIYHAFYYFKKFQDTTRNPWIPLKQSYEKFLEYYKESFKNFLSPDANALIEKPNEKNKFFLKIDKISGDIRLSKKETKKDIVIISTIFINYGSDSHKKYLKQITDDTELKSLEDLYEHLLQSAQ